MRSYRTLVVLGGAGTLVLLGSLLTAAAEGTEFRIQTRVYMDGQKQPVSENTTLFKDGIVYDYIVDPKEVTMFDPDRRKRFVLLDLNRKLRTSIPTETVAAYMQRVQQVMAQGKAVPIQQFFQNPVFEIDTDPETDELVFDSKFVSYRIASTPAKSQEVMHAYIRFANSYAQLNTITKPGSPPPFPRMRVNDELEKRGLMPTKLEFTAKNPAPLAGAAKVTLRSVHTIDWKLYAEDLRRIDETQQQLVTFKNVQPEEYLQLNAAQPQQAQRPAKAKAR